MIEKNKNRSGIRTRATSTEKFEKNLIFQFWQIRISSLIKKIKEKETCHTLGKAKRNKNIIRHINIDLTFTDIKL